MRLIKGKVVLPEIAQQERSALPSGRGLFGSLALSGLIAAISFGIASSATAGDHAHRTARDIVADKAVSEYLRNSCHVGISIAVVDADHTYFYNYGSTSRDKVERPTPLTIYELASVTKTFTASLAARAVVDGRMTLDGDFRSDLPGDYRNLAWNGQPITLRTLLTHYSGMPRDIPDSDALFADKESPDFNARLFALNQGFGRKQFLAALHDIHLRSAPGDKQAYSNAGYLVIGLGLEHVLGEPMDALMRQYIFQPLGMTSTGFTLKGDELARIVNGYDRYGRVTPRPPENAGAAWGLYASTADMAKYVRWQLDESNPVVRLSHQALTGSGSDGEAMAWNLGGDQRQPLIWHGGGSLGMSSQVVLYPKQHEGYVLLANDACEGTEGALKNLAETMHAAEVKSDP
ncbi:CubicO group peptidase (beta-lactamase class C family) [Luteibacter jiangsuensis]|uniref:CubicO group peptidase (Beta-lactamase class C family) n=1 Tax=Luteibacter jiangsuensis TaxID=637577 RepID=A0ABT9T090_9GAMM|nr:serine hydrolase domain-containing protein [Luteibacter jiangsuensis]MDQ0010679.1 CubicO group peptidase (beta-lactamase class C family) [Luteibacter jiangsuensis]